MEFHAPQLIITALITLRVGISLALYGKPKRPDTFDLIDVLVAPAIWFSLLWWGGFYG